MLLFTFSWKGKLSLKNVLIMAVFLWLGSIEILKDLKIFSEFSSFGL